jgi:hypothetical protein
MSPGMARLFDHLDWIFELKRGGFAQSFASDYNRQHVR